MSVTEKSRRQSLSDTHRTAAAGSNGALPAGQIGSDAQACRAGGEEPASLRERLTKLIAKGQAPEKATATLVGLIVAGKLELSDADMRRFLYPAIRAEARNIARFDVRRAEASVRGLVADGVPFREAIQHLATETVYVPSAEGRVNWLDLTAEQHDERADYFRHLEAGNRLGAETHELAAEAIREAGVTRLRDLAASEDAA